MWAQSRASLAMALAIALVLCSRAAFAGSINYGNFAANTVVYQQVTEASVTDPVPLYGTPTTSGDSLQFAPNTFAAFSSNGGGTDLTDGNLNVQIKADPNRVINTFSVNEVGDYTLTGTGGSVSVSAPVFLRIDQVNNVALVNPITYSGNIVFTPSNGSYTAPGDNGTGVIWTGSLSVNVAAILAANSIPGGATSIHWTMDNILTATSVVNGIAEIEKKQIGGVAITVGTGIPEPSTVVLAGIGLSALLLYARRRSL